MSCEHCCNSSCDDDIITFDLDQLSSALSKNLQSDMKEFGDLVNLSGALNREVYLDSIEYGIGSSIDAYIRFWNKWDRDHQIPVSDRTPIKIYIDSYGGSLNDTFTIIDSIKLSETPVWTICNGVAYSGGFFVLINGHKRLAYPHSSFLFHEGATSNEGTAGQFENYSAFYKKQLKQLQDIVVQNTGITEEEYKEIRKDDIWYDAKEALDKGIIDGILGVNNNEI